ncbi:MAG: PTS sugar transporter subunit IIB [Negativicutes bacterium]|nr:PTS sugar transporter subunit IIB [Negativicutes bacterium]
MANIVLARIDSRLIHGQVITKWMKQANASHILIIDDTLSKDPFMGKVYKIAAPPSCQVHIKSVDEGVEALKNNESPTRLLLLFKDVATAKRCWQAGLLLKQLQVGGLIGAPGRKVVFQSITLIKSEADDLLEMQKGGVEIIFQTVPEDYPGKLTDVLQGAKL